MCRGSHFVRDDLFLYQWCIRKRDEEKFNDRGACSRASCWAEGCSKFGDAETGYRAGRVYRFGNEGTRCGGTIPAYTRNEGGCLV